MSAPDPEQDTMRTEFDVSDAPHSIGEEDRLSSVIAEVERIEQALRFSNERLRLIARVTGTVIGTASLAEQTRELAEQVRRAFGVDACVVRTLEGEELVLFTSVGVPDEQLYPRISVGWGISQEMLSKRRAMFIADVRTHPVTAASVGTLPTPYRFVSYAGAPLLAEDRVLGLLGIYSATEMVRFTEVDLEHLQIVANHIAIAILNERLYREVRSQKEQLEEQIGERKRLEEQLFQAQKMDGIGRLAGGIAHDFNNLLTAILGYAELAELEIEPDSPIRDYLTAVQQASKRAAALTGQLLAFARKQIIEPRVICLNDLILDMGNLLRRLLGADIELITAPYTGLGRVKADPNQITQVLVNLAINARDAMPGGGKLTIETDNVALDAEYAQAHADLTPGFYVLMAVSDTGAGIAEEVRARIFEPFFTTKGPGKGTGLGLATCYGIVKQSGGHIAVYSEQGQGTTFKVYLPSVDEMGTPQAPPPVYTDLPTGTETILLAEDETMLRDLAVQMLRTQGYTVLEASHGKEALRIAQAYPETIHIVVTDLIMPQMGGRALVERLQELRPGVKILYVSGYTDDALLHHGVLGEGAAFLQKPYTSGTLAREVRAILDSVEATKPHDPTS